MRILTIINNKGGVGKTTATQNIGGAIATFTQHNVLLIDLDPQASLTKSFGIYLQPEEPTVAEFILGKSTLKKTALSYKETKLAIIPSSSSLVEEQTKISKNRSFPFSLLRALEREKELGENPYEFIIIDSPPSTSVLTDIALVTCNRYYVPLQAEYFSYEGLREFIDYANRIVTINPVLELGGVFASRYNPNANKRFSKEVVQRVAEQLKDKFLQSYIRDNIALSEAQSKGQHIFDYDSRSNGAIDYYNLTKEILFYK